MKLGAQFDDITYRLRQGSHMGLGNVVTALEEEHKDEDNENALDDEVGGLVEQCGEGLLHQRASLNPYGSDVQQVHDSRAAL
jgi:hypothetical protein